MHISLIVSITSNLTHLHGFLRNHFLCLNPQNKYSESKVKFWQASNYCKGVLEAAELVYATKKRSPSLPRNLAVKTLSELLIVFSTKVNLLYLPYSADRRRCLLHLIKQTCLLKIFLRILILMTQVLKLI